MVASKAFDFLKRAKALRSRGYSYAEIAAKFHIAKSTAHLWTKNIRLNKRASIRLAMRSLFGKQKSKQILNERKAKLQNEIQKRVVSGLLSFKPTKEMNKLFCALLFWAEGAKKTTHVTFINSDPVMVITFLHLFRTSFNLEESKFRALVHVHEYHNEEEIKKFWSQITKIPLSQFNRSYLKTHTKKRIRTNYKGTISIRYYDFKIALELKMIYNIYAQNIRGVAQLVA